MDPDRVGTSLQVSKAQLVYQINLVEYSLSQIATIRAPWPGTVQKIRWLGQRDNDLIAELTLGVTGEIRSGGDTLPPGDPELHSDPDRISLPEQPETQEPQYPTRLSLAYEAAR